MNFKDWQKLEEDDKSVTLKHPKGHVMVISIKNLPKIHQEQIKRLKFAEGGMAPRANHKEKGVHRPNSRLDSGTSVSGNALRQGDPNESVNKIHKHNLKELKRMPPLNIKGLAKGGEVPVSMPDPQKAKDAWDGAQNGQMNRLKELVGFGDKKEKQPQPRQRYAGGTPETPVTADEYLGDDESEKTPPAAVAPPGAPITINVATPNPQQQAAPPPPPAPLPAPASKPMKAPVSSAFRQVEQPLAYRVNDPAAPPNLMNADKTLNAPAAVNQLQEAAQQRGEIEKTQARANAQAESNYLANEQMIAEQQAQAYNEVKAATDAFADYTKKNPINPKSYQENQNSSQKMATGVGLVLGGLGQGFWGGKGNNPAMDFLNKQIDRDIDAQKSRNEQQKTVYGYYHNLYGDSVVATNLAKVSANNMLVHEVAMAAARSGDQQADVRAKELGVQKAIENNQLLIDTAGRMGTLGIGGGGGAKAKEPSPEQQPGGAGVPTGNQPEKGAEHPLRGTILHPGAERAFQRLQYTPKAKDQLPEITRQYTQAQQADKALSSVNETFMNMSKAAEESGISGRAHRTLNPHAFAAVGAGIGAVGGPAGMGIGAAAGEGVGQAAQQFTNTDVNRRYDSEQSTLKGYISSALKGTNVSSGDIDEIVQKNSPEYGDSTKTKAMKLRTIRDFIKNHTETSLLKTWHMTKD